MTDALNIQGSAAVRNLEVGEVVEALGPDEQDSSSRGICRVRCKAVSDGSIGWCTIAGQQGIVFLKPC